MYSAQEMLEVEKVREIIASNQRLRELASKVRPVVRDDKGELCYIDLENVYISTTAFTMYPKIADKAEELVEYKKITTLHPYASTVSFKPTIEEVLTQIPKKDIKNIAAFETKLIGGGNPNICIDPEKRSHIAETTLYKKVKKGDEKRKEVSKVINRSMGNVGK